MPDLGPAELFIILIVVVLIFGGSRLADIGGSLGKGIKDFRSALKEEDEPEPAAPAAATQPPVATEAPLTESTPTAVKAACPSCGAAVMPGASFCNQCGARVTHGDS